MAAGRAWQYLGIEPTDEVRAIKRAYARKLKEIDVEANPEAFIALRDALEEATWQAEIGYFPEDEPDDDNVDDAAPEDTVPDENDHDGQPSPDIGFPEYDDWDEEAPRPECADTNEARIVDLLWGDEPVDQIREELLACVNAILADPEMDNIDHAARVEDWLSWVITDKMPRSDVLLDPVVQHFRWGTRAKSVGVPYAILTAANRQADRRRLANMERMGHTTLHFLQQDAPVSLSWATRVSKKNAVREFLTDIRSNNPTIEWTLNPEHVALWDDQLGTMADYDEPGQFTSSQKMRWLPWVLGWLIIQVLLRINDVW